MVSFSSYEWERKGIIYYLKHRARHTPQLILTIPVFFIFCPAALIYAYNIREKEFETHAAYRDKYIVFRSDDPRVKDVIKFDEKGNRIHLKPE